LGDDRVMAMEEVVHTRVQVPPAKRVIVAERQKLGAILEKSNGTNPLLVALQEGRLCGGLIFQRANVDGARLRGIIIAKDA